LCAAHNIVASQDDSAFSAGIREAAGMLAEPADPAPGASMFADFGALGRDQSVETDLSFPQICVELSGPGEGFIKLSRVILLE
jgi:hypothetical protein